MNDNISGSELISALQVDLGKTQDTQKSTILRWVYESIIDMRLFQIFPAHKKVDVTKCLDLPRDFVSVNYVEFCGSRADCFYPDFDNSVQCVCDDDVQSGAPIKISQQNKKLLFSDNILTAGIDKIILHYFSTPVDEDGLPMIPRDSYQAVRAYVDLQNLILIRNRNRGNPSRQNPVSSNEIRVAREAWGIERSFTIGRLVGPNNFYEAIQAAKEWHNTRTDMVPSLQQAYRKMVD